MRGVEDQLNALNETSHEQVTAALNALQANPQPTDTSGPIHRGAVEVAGYRIAYMIQSGGDTILVGAIFAAPAG